MQPSQPENGSGRTHDAAPLATECDDCGAELRNGRTPLAVAQNVCDPCMDERRAKDGDPAEPVTVVLPAGDWHMLVGMLVSQERLAEKKGDTSWAVFRRVRNRILDHLRGEG